jgi:hypothetical protein
MAQSKHILELIEKIDAHPGGPITLTQEECWNIATIIAQVTDKMQSLDRRIEKGLEILEPQSKRVSPSIVAIRNAVQILKGR